MIENMKKLLIEYENFPEVQNEHKHLKSGVWISGYSKIHIHTHVTSGFCLDA